MRYQALLSEEEHLHEVTLGSGMDRMRAGVVSASPRFIAGFRFETHPEVQAEQTELLVSECSICLQKFDIDQSYARWPCPGEHTFHHLCMLDALRATNKCPLCRHEVQPAPIPDRDLISTDV